MTKWIIIAALTASTSIFAETYVSKKPYKSGGKITRTTYRTNEGGVIAIKTNYGGNYSQFRDCHNNFLGSSTVRNGTEYYRDRQGRLVSTEKKSSTSSNGNK